MGDFQANFARGDAGIHTVEGNVAGSRAAALERKRLADQQEFELRKRQITSEHARQNAIGTKFTGATSAVEKNLAEATVGLVTADEFRVLQQVARDGGETTAVGLDGSDQASQDAAIAAQEKLAKKERKKRLKEKKRQLATLSFAGDDDIENDDSSHPVASKALANKDPTVDTSFLPDKARDAAVEAERQRLEMEWKKQQEQAKRERLEIVYSYWDGSGHRRSVTVQKGDTVEQFLEQVRKDLSSEFRELVNTSSDALLYVKEDLILPHDLTFYDLIVTKARGKSGPLFHFDVHDDVRVGAIDVRIEKDESHPGKIVQRHWYERNKHIFPASRWELYDPTKEYGSYTIGGN
jgi:protein FAM50